MGMNYSRARRIKRVIIIRDSGTTDYGTSLNVMGTGMKVSKNMIRESHPIHERWKDGVKSLFLTMMVGGEDQKIYSVRVGTN